MSAFGPERLAMLVQPDRVHRSVYADPAIFDLEMERVFGRAWLALGHESQVRNVGDYFTTRMGREPVIVIRKSEDQIGVLINRCVHRGSMVCAEGRGNAERFVCPYHGWSYDRAGILRAVPFQSGYEKGKLPAGLKAVPRVRSYRGFIFASLARHGDDLETFLGPARASFDDFVDRAPGGELAVAGGVFKHAYNGNWKLMLENHLDGAHPCERSLQSQRHAIRLGALILRPRLCAVSDASGVASRSIWRPSRACAHRGFVVGVHCTDGAGVGVRVAAALQICVRRGRSGRVSDVRQSFLCVAADGRARVGAGDQLFRLASRRGLRASRSGVADRDGRLARRSVFSEAPVIAAVRSKTRTIAVPCVPRYFAGLPKM